MIKFFINFFDCFLVDHFGCMFKNFFDFLVAVIVALIILPFFGVLYIFILIKMGKPVFFKQVRPGLNGKPFQMYKFRTMTNHRNPNGDLLPDAERLTPFGRFLRSSSFDELPSLWNVIKGDMSLVGPRPLLMEYLPLYNQEQARRHEVRPGITGWAQVNGRNAITWQEIFDFDIWYVDHHSFWLDVKILMITIKKVIIRDGISELGEATKSKFTGNKE
jgi:lipopolysaccharide/colanic/teichoic acid biosynthesis glycosyltransferase